MVKKLNAILICCVLIAVCVLAGCDNESYGGLKNTRLLNNVNATANTVKLFNYLNSNYGVKILSGQSVAVVPSNELDIIHSVTQKYPAICSFDATMLSSAWSTHSTQSADLLTSAVLGWAKSGGIVAMQWHWLSPSGAYNSADYAWYKSFYTKATEFDVSKVFDLVSSEYLQMLNDIDNLAEFLLLLQQHDIPVLFRPLHEASGGWLWWGAGGKEAYLRLWHVMYERLTVFYGLNNLIWVWNGESADWYVGDNHADIVSYDVYADSLASFNQKAVRAFNNGREVANDKKIIAMSESMTVPSLLDFATNNTRWSWFSVWCYEYIMENGEYSERYTSRQVLTQAYNHDLVITRDELEFVLFNDI